MSFPIEITESKYDVEFDTSENKIFIRAKNKGTVSRRVQIFSPKKEFPFLFAGNLEISSEHSTWVALAEREDFLDWKRGGCVIRILSEGFIEEEVFIDTPANKTKVLFIAPHLSTGGCPQYLLKKIETYKDVLDVYVVEYDYLGDSFVVQRNRIKNLLGEGRFFSLGESDSPKEMLLEILEQVSPEVVHFEEMPEHFIKNFSIAEKIYVSPERKYFITETTHSSLSTVEMKRFLPDKFIFCSKFSQKTFEPLGIPSEIWEYPIENNVKPNRREALEKLGLDPSYVHVLNVGLFTPGKNQGEIYRLAENFLDEKVMFHFVGNQAENFKHYWENLNRPENCVLWGEREDVEKFLSACDIFYFSSTFELNPLVVKEALSWQMPVMMYDIYTYMGSYRSVKNVHFLSASLTENEKLLRNLIKKLPDVPKMLRKTRRAKIVHIVSVLDSDIEKRSIESVSRLASDEIEYTIHYNPPATEIPSDRDPLFGREEIGKNLRVGHFGCFEAFRKAIAEDFSDDYEFLVVCERDCLLEKPVEEVRELLQKTFSLMEREKIEYFSFGDTVDLDNGYLQSEKIRDLPGGFAFLTGKIIGLQFIIFSRAGRDFLKEMFNTRGWHGMDIWLNVVFGDAGKQMGILNERVTTQIDGISLIDNTEKIFKANQK